METECRDLIVALMLRPRLPRLAAYHCQKNQQTVWYDICTRLSAFALFIWLLRHLVQHIWKQVHQSSTLESLSLSLHPSSLRSFPSLLI